MVNVASGNRCFSSLDQLIGLTAGAAQREHPAGALERGVVPARRSPSDTSPRRLGALSDGGVHLGVFHDELRRDFRESSVKRHLNAAAVLLVRRLHAARRG